MATPALHVIDLRPRALARRAGAQRELLVARRRRVAPGHQRPLSIVAGVLDRASGVTGRDLDAWERLLDLLADHDGTAAIEGTAAAANLFALAVFDDVTDHEALTDLAGLLGHQRLARLQHRHGSALETHPALPVTTRAIRRLLRPDLRARLLADACPPELVAEVDAASLRGAHALLCQGVDRSWMVPVLDAPEEVLDIVRRGTVTEWRHQMALLMRDPWSAYAVRLTELAEQTGDARIASVVTGLVELSRERATPGTDQVRHGDSGDRPVAALGAGGPADAARHLGGATQHG